MRRRGAAVAIVALALPASAAALTVNQTVLLDRPSGDAPLPYDGAGRGFVQAKSISADGCYIVFSADSDPLFAGDDNGARNLFRYSRCGGPTVVQVNTSSSGVPAEFGTTSAGASISDDGNRVAFRSASKTLDPLSDGSPQIYVKDLTTGVLKLVSRGESAVGTPVKTAESATISGDGQHVVFVASGVIDTDNVNGVANQYDVFERNMIEDTTHMVSVTAANAAGGNVDSDPGISKDGKVVSFASSAKLAAGDTDAGRDAYARQGIDNTGTDSTRLVSTTAGADAAFGRVDVSDDGLRVAWTNGKAWEALCNPTCAAAVQLDVPAAGGSNTSPSAGDAAFARTNNVAPTRVFFRSSSPLVATDTNGRLDLYTRTLAAPATSLLTDGTLTHGINNGSATDNAQLVAFQSDTPELPASGGFVPQAYLRALPSGVTTLISAPDRVNDAADADITLHPVSADGRFVVFESPARAFGAVLGDFELLPQVLLRDVVTGTTTLMSAAPDGTAGNNRSRSPSIDNAGDKVTFISESTNLPGAGASTAAHAYLRDVASGAMRMLDVSGTGDPADDDAQEVRISADGTKAAFVSPATNLPGAPNDGFTHVYLVDLASGATQIVDRASDSTIGNRSSGDIDLDADGSRVAFQTSASNLGIANGGTEHVFVRDVAASSLIWVSVPQSGNPTDGFAHRPFLSADGHKIAFTSNSASFGYGQTTGDTHAFLRDLDSGAMTDLGAGVPGLFTDQPVLNADATKVALTAGTYDAPADTYVRDIASGAITPAAARDGTALPPRGGSRVAALSASGACLVFLAASDDVVAGGYGPDLLHLYLRALDASCLPTPGGPGPGGGDTTAPVISAFSMTNKRFAVAARRTAASAKRKRAKKGTTFRFTLSEAAATKIVIARKSAGRRKGKRCVRPTRKLRKAKRCSRFTTAATLKRSKTAQGANRIAYSGRIGKKKLRPGPYRATLTATDAAGNRSRARRVSFRVVRP
jgi:Tol biopolymer transport system component